MIDLAPELYDEIVSHFQYPEAHRQKRRRVQCPSGYERFRNPKTTDIEALLCLRLTSKAFNRAATQALLRFTRLVWHPVSSSEGPDFFAATKKSLAHDNPFSSAIKRVRFEFSMLYRGSRQSSHLKHPGVEVAHFEDRLRPLSLELPHIVRKLPELESLDVSSKKWKTTDDGSSPPSSPPVPDVDLMLVASSTQALVDGLSSQAFEHLTELCLSLACTYEFVKLSAISDVLFSRLRHLYLGILDATGTGGSKDYSRWSFEYDDGEEDMLFSNLQELHPNTEHAHGVFDLVARCPNLETLGLSGTQFLDANLLEWKPSSKGLRDIYLSRVKLSPAKLIQLCSPSKDLTLDSPFLSRLWLEDVDLTAGKWTEVFAHLCKCPVLSYLNPENLGYARGGDSFHLRATNGRPWEDWRNIWTEHEPDDTGLEEVVQMLADRAGGMEKYREMTFTSMELMPIDDYA